MEELIKKYDYSTEDVELQQQMSENLENDTEKYATNVKLAQLKKILSAFTTKVCVKGFREKQQYYHEWMSVKTLQTILLVIDICIKNKRLTKEDCHCCLIELLIQLFKSGPGVIHIELINTILSSELKFKEYFQKHEGEALKIMKAVKGFEFPTDLSQSELKNVYNEYGQIVNSLLELFKSAKILPKVMGEVTLLIIRVLELRSGEANQILYEIVGDLDFEKSKEHIPVLLRRLEPLFTDSSYPWKVSYSSNAGLYILRAITPSYEAGNEIPDEVHKCMINICKHCMADTTERYDEEEDIETVYGLVYTTVLPAYCQKVVGTKSASVINPLIPEIVKMLSDENETMSYAAKSLIMQIGTMSPQLLASEFQTLLDWCITTESKPDFVFYAVPSIYPHNTDPMTDRFQKLFKKFCIKICMNSYGYVLPLLMKVAELQPKLFNKDNINLLCKYLDDTLMQYQILAVLSSVSKENPDVVCEQVTTLLSIKDKTLLQNGAYYINQTLVNVALENQQYVKPAFDYFMKRLNANLKDQTMTLMMVDSLQKFSDKYQTAELKLYRECLNSLKKTGVTPQVRTTATSLLEDLERRK